MSLFEHAMNGDISALDAYIELYEQHKALGEQLAELKEIARLERERYGKETVIRKGYQVELMPGRSVWNYNNVSAWNSTKNRLKDIEKMAQMASTGKEVTDMESGEVIEPAERTFTADTIKLTYKG
jgi:hypothetical protein